MSKRKLLEETTIRRFMALANLEPLSDRFIKEELGDTEEEADENPEMAAEPDMPGDEEEVDLDMDDAGEEDFDDAGLEMGGGGEVSPEELENAIAVLARVAQQHGANIELDQDGEEDMDGMDDMDDMPSDEEDMEMGDGEEGGEEGQGEPEMDDAEEDMDEAVQKEEKKEMDESELDESTLSEDDLVENVLRRVTARLLSEAKKAKMKKEGVKAKMQEKKKKKKQDEEGEGKKKEDKEGLKEASHKVTHKKMEGNPLLNKGGNKFNPFKGEDMESGAAPETDSNKITHDKKSKVLNKGKVGKVGGKPKGGHEWSPAKQTKSHTVTHDSKSKVLNKGKNKG